MKRADVVIAGLVMLAVFGLVFVGQMGSSAKFSSQNGDMVAVGACKGGKFDEGTLHCQRDRKDCVGTYKDASGKFWYGTHAELQLIILNLPIAGVGGGQNVGFDFTTPVLVSCPGTYETACFQEAGSTVAGTEGTEENEKVPCQGTFKQGNCRRPPPFWPGLVCVEKWSWQYYGTTCPGARQKPKPKDGC
jgi:hypothetical protein